MYWCMLSVVWYVWLHELASNIISHANPLWWSLLEYATLYFTTRLQCCTMPCHAMPSI